MKKYLIIAFCLILAIMSFTFYKLGGFLSPELSEFSAPDYYIYGEHYKGKLKEKAFGNLFDKADNYIKEHQINASSGALYYNDPQTAEDVAEAFVGFITEDTLSSTPEGFERIKLDARQVVQANIKSHYLVSPINIYQNLEEFAEEKGIEVSKYPGLEIYRGERDVIIQIPLESQVR
ncbi:MAG: hypothetical protein ACK4ND_04850 [Cytophagaceae bacterium]